MSRRRSDDMPLIIITNAKLYYWHMYTSTGRIEFVDDNDDKYLYFVNAEKYRYARNAINIKQVGIVRCMYKLPST